LLNQYEDLFGQLEAVREVGLYVGPFWTDYASYLAFPAALFSGYQVHMVCHEDAMAGALQKYRVVFAPWLPVPELRESLKKIFADFITGGGRIVAAVTNSDYLGNIDRAKWGIRQEEKTISDASGKEKKEKVWQETLAQRAQMAKDVLWHFAGEAVEVVPYDFNTRWAFINAAGEKEAYHPSAHWTKFQVAANMHAPAREAAPLLKAAFAKAISPLVEKDVAEIAVCAMRPRAQEAQGIYLFVSSFVIPQDEAWTRHRVPFFFWPSWVGPTAATLKVKKAGIGAVYDLLKGREIETKTEGDRLVFTADLGAVEGRVYALLPARIAAAKLMAPAKVKAGEWLRPQFILQYENGKPLPVLAPLHIQQQDAEGRTIASLYRALPASGLLPAFPAPASIKSPLVLTVSDLLSGQTATAKIEIEDAPMLAAAAPPVTVHRGDSIHRFLRDAKGQLRIVVASGAFEWGKDGKILRAANPELERDRGWAQSLASALGAGVSESKTAITSILSGHPWQGGGARNNHTLPRWGIEGPVIILGSSQTNAMLQELERAAIAPRALAAGNVASGRAV
ncbi:MAG: hypothetical protein N3A66_08050, partial [Planctomycetota bacterium]|nr:hypothetical protein [Planctomycetota bacterium]